MSQTGDQLVEETIELLKEFKSNLLPCIYMAKDMLIKLKENAQLNTNDGISLLTLKNKMFLNYLIDLVQILNTKLNGESLSSNGALERLVEERTVLEKIRPIEHRLKYQIDKLMRMLNTGNLDQSDPMNYKPNFASIISQDGEDLEAEINLDDATASEEKEPQSKSTEKLIADKRNDIYVPPRLAQMRFTDAEERKTRALQRAKSRAINSSLMTELRREFDDTPEEEHNSLQQQKSGISKFLKHKKRFEEENFVRLNLTKKQKAQARKMTTLSSIADDVTRFEDISALNIDNFDDFSASKRKRKPKVNKSSKKKYGNKKRSRH